MTPIPSSASERPRPKLYAVVPCAGAGTRSQSAQPKQYVHVAGDALVSHTLRALASVARLSSLVVVVAADDAWFEACVEVPASKPLQLCRGGGATRAASVLAGLLALDQHGALDEDWVLVHDAARCLITPEAVNRLIDACLDDAVGGLLALPVADTLKQAHQERSVQTLDRRDKWAAQTPQMFRLGLLRKALQEAGPGVTDEASAIEALGLQPRLVRGELANFKVTWPEEFALAAQWLQWQSQLPPTSTSQGAP